MILHIINRRFIRSLTSLTEPNTPRLWYSLPNASIYIKLFGLIYAILLAFLVFGTLFAPIAGYIILNGYGLHIAFILLPLTIILYLSIYVFKWQWHLFASPRISLDRFYIHVDANNPYKKDLSRVVRRALSVVYSVPEECIMPDDCGSTLSRFTFHDTPLLKEFVDELELNNCPSFAVQIIINQYSGGIPEKTTIREIVEEIALNSAENQIDLSH